jgi:hypothetical protein
MNKMHNGNNKVKLDQLQTVLHLACLAVYVIASFCNWIVELTGRSKND